MAKEHGVELRSRPASGPQSADGHEDIDLSVIIVTYRSAADIGGCLAAVGQATTGIPAEVIVVDNASGDHTVAATRAASSGTRIIERTKNNGFAGGCRTGAGVARGGWLLFLNPDTAVAPDGIRELLQCARDHPAAGIIGGRFVREDGTVDPRSWWRRPTPWSTLCFALGLSTFLAGSRIFDPEAPRPWKPDADEVQFVSIVSGAFMLVKRKLWDELDGFDPAFFMYGEDADFCLRAAAKGYRPMVTARAVCQNAGGKSSSSIQKLVLLFTGKCTVARRHFPLGLRRVGVYLLVTGVLVRAAASRWSGLASLLHNDRPTAHREDWRALWSARDEWRGGWIDTTP
jgi:N-acetylglucosaminyl-diphospho-decaprenol L-rhamnosyltransferase